MIRLDVSVVDRRGRPVGGPQGPRDFETTEDGTPRGDRTLRGHPRGALTTPPPPRTGGLVVTPRPRGGPASLPARRHREHLSTVSLGARPRGGPRASSTDSSRDGDWVRLINLATGRGVGRGHSRRAAGPGLRWRDKYCLLPRGVALVGPRLRTRGSWEIQETALSPETGAASESVTSGLLLVHLRGDRGAARDAGVAARPARRGRGPQGARPSRPRGFPQLRNFDPAPAEGGSSLARLATTTIYFVDAAGLDGLLPEPGGRLMPAFEMAWTRSGGATDLAEATGGFTSRFSPTRSCPLSRRASGEEMRNYYVVGYVPPRPDDGRFRIGARESDRPGASARTKKGYLAARPRRIP